MGLHAQVALLGAAAPPMPASLHLLPMALPQLPAPVASPRAAPAQPPGAGPSEGSIIGPLGRTKRLLTCLSSARTVSWRAGRTLRCWGSARAPARPLLHTEVCMMDGAEYKRCRCARVRRNEGSKTSGAAMRAGSRAGRPQRGRAQRGYRHTQTGPGNLAISDPVSERRRRAPSHPHAFPPLSHHHHAAVHVVCLPRDVGCCGVQCQEAHQQF